MYPYLKQDTFFIKQDNGGIFFRNNYGNIEINNSHAYEVFTTILPYLDGKHSHSLIIKKIDNERIKEFVDKLLTLLKEKNFLIMRSSPFTSSEENSLYQTISYYGDYIYETVKENLDSAKVRIFTKDKRIGELFQNALLKCHLENIDILDYEEFSYFERKGVEILLNPSCSFLNENVKDPKGRSLTYLIREEDDSIEIIDLFNLTLSNLTESRTDKTPYHLYNIIAGILSIELFFLFSKIKETKLENEKYVYSFRKHRGSFEEINQ